jgi:hypothetical protein
MNATAAKKLFKYQVSPKSKTVPARSNKLRIVRVFGVSQSGTQSNGQSTLPPRFCSVSFVTPVQTPAICPTTKMGIANPIITTHDIMKTLLLLTLEVSDTGVSPWSLH